MGDVIEFRQSLRISTGKVDCTVRCNKVVFEQPTLTQAAMMFLCSGITVARGVDVVLRVRSA
jgi:hypothetical protein